LIEEDVLGSARKAARTPLVMLTAYDFISARLATEAGVDLLLVGDSAATTVLGHANTRDVSIDEMLMLTRAVRRGVDHAMQQRPSRASAAEGTVRIIGDLPFGTYEESDAQACASAARFRDAGADLVKIEGAGPNAARARAIIASGIPVVGHVGLLPQSARSAMELRARGRTAPEALQLVEDARALDHAGVSLLVVEAVPSVVAQAITARVRCPVIGIGAGAEVDGQVLVYPDLLGLSLEPRPRFVRVYADLRTAWLRAVEQFAADVRRRAFPVAREEYRMADEERASFVAGLR
jgi:3-methyl-2-oxobutanoate hydroxymethyltransferase